MSWQGWVFTVGLLLAMAAVYFLVDLWVRGRVARRERIDVEAHEAYMNGGGYDAYFAVYRKHGIIKKEQ